MNGFCLFHRFPWLRLIGVALLIIIVMKVDIRSTLRILGSANINYVIIAFLCTPVHVLFKTFRWQLLLRAQNINFSFRGAYLAYLSSIFVGLLTPGRLGELIKAIYLKNETGISTTSALPSVVVDRLFDLMVLLIAGGFAANSISPLGNNHFLSVSITVLFTIGVFSLFYSNAGFRRISRLGTKLGARGHRLFGMDGAIAEMRQGLLRLDKFTLLLAAIVSCLSYLVFFFQCYLLALSVDIKISFLQTIYAISLGSLVTLLPISISGVGTRDAAIISYLGALGVPPVEGFGFSLLVFAVFYGGGGLMGGMAWLIKPVKLSGADRTGELNG